MQFLLAFGQFHVYILLLTVVVIIYSDHKGFQYFRGTVKTLSPQFLTWSHRFVWTGLISMIATGAALLIPSYDYHLYNAVFYVKMGFVLVLIINGIAIGTLSNMAATTPFAELSPEQKRTLLVSGGLSALGWAGSAFIGLFLL